ncbi:LUC7 N-terminus domain-containing protein [Forsythia ovata]|uniref:LUC7 N-terminus domain-containing protein n=1 Tax=Forsythia ovata TaxID=205694 RepID=A0ABD1X1Y7_9LAMI
MGPPKSGRAISQQAFDEMVKENMEDLGMDPTEALQDAIQTLTLQGVDLSGIVTCVPGESNPVMECLDKLKQLNGNWSDLNHVEDENAVNEIVELLEELYDMCEGKGSGNAAIACFHITPELSLLTLPVFTLVPARALLDELMGTARNLTEEERKGYKEIRWDDKEVCGFYMVRFCPHDLFVNTRSDLGVCPRIHDPKLKESFEKSPRHDSYVPKFEAELALFCEKLVSDLDRRVKRGQERLEQEVEVPPPLPLSAEKSEQLSVLEEKIKNLLEQVESLGETGKVDEAEALMRKVDTLNAEKTALTQQPQQDKLLMIAQEKKMALCEICGSFLVANDAAERTQSHVTGKQHMGYGMVRDFLSEYKVLIEKVKLLHKNPSTF